ncbi:glycosyl transferase, family 39 [Candidatus Moduliflexus flocculans]|uniref:Glycosyl transferase, family 39 n=1 Tax=Candidatus Moduliflexus flocculans TaxID=1499966 RepID=A0A081BN65_9BACT|nr:glycosyl transferase, family 39 [Candidatus Moduliflexus flocculans]
MKHLRYLWAIGFLMLGVVSLGIGTAKLLTGLPHGLRNGYYNSLVPDGTPVFEQRDASFALDYAKTHLKTSYSARWEGALYIPQSGSYEFSLGSDDGSILYIGEQTVIYNWRIQTFTRQNGVILLQKGVVPFRVDFMQNSGAANLSVSWKMPGKAKFSPLPSTYLFAEIPTPQALQRDRVLVPLWHLLLGMWGAFLAFTLGWGAFHRHAVSMAVKRSWLGGHAWRIWSDLNRRLAHLIFLIDWRFSRQRCPWLYKRLFVSAAHLAMIFTVSLLVVYNHLGERSVIGADEAIHTRVANTIANTGNWYQLEYRGKPYAQKPPLKIWLSALTFRFIGNSEFWVRFWDATFALATAFIIYFLGRTAAHAAAGLMGALILLLCENYLYIHCARTGVQDSAMIFFLTSALALFWTRERSPIHYYFAGLAMGCCSLTKGGMGIAALMILSAFLLLSRQFHEFRRKEWYIMAAISLVIPACWFLPNMLLIRGYTEQALTANIIGRITGSRHSDFAGKPWYYYFSVLSAYYSPWVWFTPAAIIWGAVHAFRRRFLLFLMIWIIVIFGGFSAASLKLNWYINPVYPPLALLLGYWLHETCRWLRAGWRQEFPALFLAAIGGIGVVFIAAFFPIYQESSRPRERYPIQEFVTYLEQLPQESYQVVLFALNENDDITDQEHYYLNRIRSQIVTIETLQALEQRIKNDARRTFVITVEQIALTHPLFQHSAIRYPLPAQGQGTHKVVFPYNHPPDHEFPLEERRS